MKNVVDRFSPRILWLFELTVSVAIFLALAELYGAFVRVCGGAT